MYIRDDEAKQRDLSGQRSGQKQHQDVQDVYATAY